MNFDIAIIGGGPAGYTAAERAGANGLKAVLFEKKAMGEYVSMRGVFLLKLCYILLKYWIASRVLPNTAFLPNLLRSIYPRL